MSNSNIDDRELFRLASLIGCEPQDEERHRKDLKQAIQQELLKARINSLLDLEQWIKLHDLGQEMILDGIKHMVKSNLQVPDQPRINHDDRIADLQKELKENSDE